MFARNASIVFGVALVVAAVMPLRASEWDKKTVITINEPVQVPSCCNAEHVVVLEPGKYVMALVDSSSDRHIVRIFSEDEKTVITTILAIPNYRLTPTGNTVIQFWETPAGQPRAMRAWFYPGDNFGQEFAYHKTKSLDIAKAVNAPVPAVTVETEADLATAPVVIVDAKGDEKPMETTMVARNDPPAPPAPAPAQLPATASEYPLIGLLGLGSLAVSAFISRLSQWHKTRA